MKHKIAPSVLAADFGNLAEEFKTINESQADWFHIDIMDGKFVPNISFGKSITKRMKSLAEKPLDVHLMIMEPERFIDDFAQAGADNITVHVEASLHLHRTIQSIKEKGMKAGVAINPHTPISSFTDIIEDIDIVCLMSVNPGFGGQKFIYSTLQKIKALKNIIETQNTNTLIEIDGGVGLHNAEEILRAGADILVAGSAVFKSENPKSIIQKMKDINVASRWV